MFAFCVNGSLMLNSTVSLQIPCKVDKAGRTSDVSAGAEGLLPGRPDDHHAYRRVILPTLRIYNIINPRHYLRHKRRFNCVITLCLLNNSILFHRYNSGALELKFSKITNITKLAFLSTTFFSFYHPCLL